MSGRWNESQSRKSDCRRLRDFEFLDIVDKVSSSCIHYPRASDRMVWEACLLALSDIASEISESMSSNILISVIAFAPHQASARMRSSQIHSLPDIDPVRLSFSGAERPLRSWQFSSV
tara:strand:+ start:429 stop:782 length:354 start_codon:yes stop_codon:yes gene_type:complete